MSNLKQVRLLGAAALLSASALAAVAQQEQAPSPPADKPPMAKPEPAPSPQATTPPSPQRQAAPEPSAMPASHALVGLSALSSDGSRVGEVRAVNTGADGKITTLHIRTGGFLGFGGRIVAVPEGKFIRTGQNIQLGLTAEEVSKLPAVKDAS